MTLCLLHRYLERKRVSESLQEKVLFLIEKQEKRDKRVKQRSSDEAVLASLPADVIKEVNNETNSQILR